MTPGNCRTSHICPRLRGKSKYSGKDKMEASETDLPISIYNQYSKTDNIGTRIEWWKSTSLRNLKNSGIAVVSPFYSLGWPVTKKILKKWLKDYNKISLVPLLEQMNMVSRYKDIHCPTLISSTPSVFQSSL